jgi:hypothetical protein
VVELTLGWLLFFIRVRAAFSDRRSGATEAGCSRIVIPEHWADDTTLYGSVYNSKRHLEVGQVGRGGFGTFIPFGNLAVWNTFGDFSLRTTDRFRDPILGVAGQPKRARQFVPVSFAAWAIRRPAFGSKLWSII